MARPKAGPHPDSPEPRPAERATRPAPAEPAVTIAARTDSAEAARTAALSVLNPKPALELTRLEQPDRRGLAVLVGLLAALAAVGALAPLK
jgi:hypothetical protein